MSASSSALCLSRHLREAPDPQVLYRQLAGGAPGTLLFETGEALEGAGRRSILVPAVAARLECRGSEVRIAAVSAQGAGIVAKVAADLPGYVRERTESEVLLAFPRTEETEDEARLRAPSPLDALRALVRFDVTGDTSPFAVFAAGVFAYDFVEVFEPLPAPASDPLGYPDAVFFLAESAVLIDGAAGVTRLYATAYGDDRRAVHDAERRIAALAQACEEAIASPTPSRVIPEGVPSPTAVVDLDDATFERLVRTMKEHIVAGDVFQIVGSRSFSAPCLDPVAAYGRLRVQNPSPYHFFFADVSGTLFGASPETSVRVERTQEGLVVHVHPIAGTRRRGATPDEDDRIEAELRLSEKEVAEHMMLVDLARNDIARVAIPGTRRVKPLLSVERYSQVMHLVSSVSGRLRPGLDALHAYGASANMGTLVGAPKVRAAELLRTYEGQKRGAYGGAIGWLSHDGSFDSAIVIRSALVKEGVAHVRAGAGIVFDSDPADEADETRRKAAAVLRAVGARLPEGKP